MESNYRFISQRRKKALTLYIDSPALVIIDGEEDEEDYEPTPAGEAGTSGGYRPKK